MIDASLEYLASIVGQLRRRMSANVRVRNVAASIETPHEKLLDIAKERQDVTHALKTLLQNATAADRYNLEYSTAAELATLTGVPCDFPGTHYWFWSPLMNPEILNSIVGNLRQIEYPAPPGMGIRGAVVIDVGAGNGDLLRAFLSAGFTTDNMAGIDISAKSVERVRETGVRYGILGTIPAKGLYGDVICLSYFVDRDSDQKGTFKKAAMCLSVQSILILEGLFPCEMTDSNGIPYGTANVTKGRDTVEDIELVVAEFESLSITLQEILVGQRLVYSLDGPEVLPSYTLVFKKRASRSRGVCFH